jgi:hypothetical protein
MLTIAMNKFMQKMLPMKIKTINKMLTKVLLSFIGPVSYFPPSMT